MAQESKAESGREFARDMRRVRESRHITVGDLHDETKIPQGLIEAFEETALFDHPQFNRVYLRSFVRTYANVLGIEPDVALEALEEALSDRYAGSLAVEYLGEAPEPATAGAPEHEADDVEDTTAEEIDQAAATPRGRKPAKVEEPEEPIEPEEESTAAELEPTAEEQGRQSEAEAEAPPSEEEEEDVSPAFVSTTSEAAAGYGIADEAEAADESEWSAQSPPRPKPTAEKTPYRQRPGGMDWRWIAGGIGVLVVGVVVWVILSMGGDDTSNQGEMAAAADTVAADTVEAQEAAAASPGPMPAIGDTIDVYIVAAEEKVDPIRVTVDDDLRRPYWIDQGDSMLFQPTGRIVIEELLDNIRLNIEGASYPTSRRDEQGRIVITRDSLQAYFGAGRSE